MRLIEAQALYRTVAEDPRPSRNRRLETFLKKGLRAEAEKTLGKPWEELVSRYKANFLFEGDPLAGEVTLTLREVNVCQAHRESGALFRGGR